MLVVVNTSLEGGKAFLSKTRFLVTEVRLLQNSGKSNITTFKKSYFKCQSTTNEQNKSYTLFRFKVTITNQSNTPHK